MIMAPGWPAIEPDTPDHEGKGRMAGTLQTWDTAGVILAAGEGRRMRPLTGLYPKPALPILGVPVIEIIAEKLIRAGISTLHCNLFHLPDRIEVIASKRNWPITFHRERRLLGTGGGIGNMGGQLDRYETIILHNGDVLSNLDLDEAVSFHRSRGALVTMVLVSVGPPASVGCTGGGEVTGIGSKAVKGDRKLGYTGIAVLDPGALRYFPRGKPADLVDILMTMIRTRPGSVVCFEPEGGFLWGEIGSPAGYLDLHRRILVSGDRFDPLVEPPSLPLHVAAGAGIEPGAEWRGFLSVECGARLERDTMLEDCVVLEGTIVPRGSRYKHAIVYRGGSVSANR
jgi:NDP-sugar pyrophosphorylase family protein